MISRAQADQRKGSLSKTFFLFNSNLYSTVVTFRSCWSHGPWGVPSIVQRGRLLPDDSRPFAIDPQERLDLNHVAGVIQVVTLQSFAFIQNWSVFSSSPWASRIFVDSDSWILQGQTVSVIPCIDLEIWGLCPEKISR